MMPIMMDRRSCTPGMLGVERGEIAPSGDVAERASKIVGTHGRERAFTERDSAREIGERASAGEESTHSQSG